MVILLNRESEEKINMKKQITIGVGQAATTAKGFIDAWKPASCWRHSRLRV